MHSAMVLLMFNWAFGFMFTRCSLHLWFWMTFEVFIILLFIAGDIFRATSPPSFAIEVFVHCEGETRFRRLCQPFLYSQSSSNVLEVEVFMKF